MQRMEVGVCVSLHADWVCPAECPNEDSLLEWNQKSLSMCQTSQDIESFSMGRQELYLETNKVSFAPSLRPPFSILLRSPIFKTGP